MGLVRSIKAPRVAALIGVLGAFALLLGLGLGSTMKADAGSSAPPPIKGSGVNFSIEAVDQNGCDTTDGDAVCYIEPGSDFTLNVTLDPLPSTVASYEGFDVYITYTGLTSADDADASAYWPDCGFPAAHFEPGLVAAGCSIGIDPGTPSTYSGLILSNTFTCDGSGAINLVAGDGKTDLLQTVSEHHTEGDGTMETLNITCGDEPTPTNTAAPSTGTPVPMPTALPSTGTAGTDQGNDNNALLIIGALVTMAIVGLGAFGWRNARSTGK